MHSRWHCLLRTVIGVVAGVVLFCLLFALSVTAAAGGHGSYLPAKICFPWGMLIAYVGEGIGRVAVIASALQLPVYGAVLGSSCTRRPLVRRAAILLVAHILAAIFAVSRRGFFPN